MHGDPMMWVAGVRALYLQALHPRAVRGVMQNSDFRHDAWGRLMRTANFVGTTTYGTSEAAEKAGTRVRKIHTMLTAVDPETGERYRIDEPELLLWVHCAEVSSYLNVARRSGMRLSGADADTFVAEQQRAAAVVGLDPAQVPGSAAGLEAHITAMRPRLRVTPEARQAMLRSVNVHVPAAQLPLKLAVPSIGALAFASLPRWARRMYGTPGAVVTDLAATAALRAFHEGVARLPGGLLRPAA